MIIYNFFSKGTVQTPMRYALIGCGRVASSHIKAAKDNGFEIAAVCDIIDGHIDDLFARCELEPEEAAAIRRYADYREMVQAEQPELVSIALPSLLHAEAALFVIESGVNVIIEKPIAMSMAEADAIVAAADRTGVTVSACHQNRFNKAVQEMRTALEAGRFGKLSHGAVTVRWSRGQAYYQQADWRGKWASDGGTLMNQCIHGIDLLRWMCGDELVSVYGVTRRAFHDYIQAEDVGAAVLQFANGVIATVEGTVNVADDDLEEHLSLFGENGSVKLGGTSANAIDYWHFRDAPEETKDGFHEKTRNVYGNGHTSLFRDVADAVAEHRQPYVDARAGRRALETVLAIYQSSYTGQPVTLPLGDVAAKDFTGFFDK